MLGLEPNPAILDDILLDTLAKRCHLRGGRGSRPPKEEKRRCERCGLPWYHRHTDLTWHHILPVSSGLADHRRRNFVCLCRRCHDWVHSKRNAEGLWLACVPRRPVLDRQ